MKSVFEQYLLHIWRVLRRKGSGAMLANESSNTYTQTGVHRLLNPATENNVGRYTFRKRKTSPKQRYEGNREQSSRSIRNILRTRLNTVAKINTWEHWNARFSTFGEINRVGKKSFHRTVYPT